jgi:hypothetical protein
LVAKGTLGAKRGLVGSESAEKVSARSEDLGHIFQATGGAFEVFEGGAACFQDVAHNGGPCSVFVDGESYGHGVGINKPAKDYLSGFG